MTPSPSHHTFLWHDYETFGTNTRRDRPAQFAAIRTDAELNVIGAPLMLYCQPAGDFLPDPQACLITGITPQLCLEKGIPEYQFAAQIEQAFSLPGTVGVGYNTIRFDDEITRFMFWRNLIDPYAREWQNDCGRWDLLDVVRTAYALRPDGMEWPLNAEGKPSFKLTDLSAANGLLHEAAHDALSDVRATIALARLIKTAQPKLFDFCFGLHKKDRVMAELGLPTTLTQARPFLHISGMFAPERGCLALMWPLAMHPANKNELLAWDLAFDPRELAQMNAEQIRLRLFTKTADLPEGVQRLPVKSIHLNKSPTVIGNYKTLSSAMAQRWGLNLDAQLANAAHAQALPDMSGIWPAVFKRPAAATPDVDEDLYGGFVGNADRRRLNDLRQLKAQELASARPAFDDARLTELLWRYRARNFPQSLSADELARWEAHRSARLFDGEGGALTIEQLFEELDSLAESADERGEAILGALYDYAELIAPQRV
ncbi:Exodeoxyribonuclease I subunit C [Rhodoferax ferrireducens T118]|uniref:Exodeoxyribonuclease I n=1 Tax=Albidiferax ferrireducens (strain ATCC BAA-621 / DSM 15236 / T118) TaxID=338969 RepID=Q21WQ6_ALBFT|nr:exodeoxyribonuclease I [Rhodoferax ferrireducens]ABD69797.1 Exodeoxyribonuclease I subunit C [Rhodoferax ferrireducens T118]